MLKLKVSNFKERQKIKNNGGSKIKILSAAVIRKEKDDKILIIKRSDYNVWEIPGGGIEFGESPQQTVIREVKEETGLSIRPRNVIAVVSVLIEKKKYCRTEKEHLIIIVYNCKICDYKKFGPKIILDSEHKEYRWLCPKDILKLSNLAFGMKDVINKVIKSFKSKKYVSK